MSTAKKVVGTSVPALPRNSVVHKSNCINTEGALVYDAWKENLPVDDPDRTFILDGVSKGFSIINSNVSIASPVSVPNYRSATNPINRVMVEDQIRTEIANGRYVVVDSPAKITSALGAVPKSGNKVRLIHDCSRPTGHAVNDMATANHFHYVNIQDAVNIIHHKSYLAKVDLASAYRSVKLASSDHQYTGLQWRFAGDSHDTYMIDTRLPFGARLSPEIFHRLTQAVCRMMHANGHCPVLAYLDDFLIVGDDEASCNNTLTALLHLLLLLGFAINYNNATHPSTRLTFLGIVFDTDALTLELPAGKLAELNTALSTLLTTKKCTKRKLQSIAGKLSWATQVIYGGRFHLRRLWDKIQELQLPHHRTRVTSDLKADINWWLQFMGVFNGLTPMVDTRPQTPLWLDACSQAAGAVYGDEFVYTPFASWPDSSNLHINFKKTLALETAVARWGAFWRNSQVVVYSDNQAAVGIINKGTTNNPFVMASLRRVWWSSAIHNFRIKAVYLPGHANVLADAVSRLHDRSVTDKVPVSFVPFSCS